MIVAVTGEQEHLDIPIVCENCGAIYASGIGLAPGASPQLTVSGIGSLCPRCRHENEVPSGTYSAMGNAISVIAASPDAESQLEKIIAVLRFARQQGLSGAEVIEAVRETAPDTAGMFAFLASAKGQALATWLTLLVTVLMWAVSQLQQQDTLSEQDAQRLVVTAIEQVHRDEQQHPQALPSVERPHPVPRAGPSAQDRKAKRKRERDARRRQQRRRR